MRFTVGSLATGVALFVILLAVWQVFGERQRQAVRTANTTTADGRLVVGNVDPTSGTVVLDGPNDLSLQDADEWSGGMDAATW